MPHAPFRKATCSRRNSRTCPGEKGNSTATVGNGLRFPWEVRGRVTVRPGRPAPGNLGGHETHVHAETVPRCSKPAADRSRDVETTETSISWQTAKQRQRPHTAECHSAPGETGARVPATVGGAQKHAEWEETVPEEQKSRDALHRKSAGRAAPETEADGDLQGPMGGTGSECHG